MKTYDLPLPCGLVLAFLCEEIFWHAVKFGDTTLSRGGLGQGSRLQEGLVLPLTVPAGEIPLTDFNGVEIIPEKIIFNRRKYILQAYSLRYNNDF